MPAEIGYELVAKKTEREHLQGKARDIHEADLEYLKTVEQNYLQITARNSGFKTISCAPDGTILPIEKIHLQIMKIIYAVIQWSY